MWKQACEFLSARKKEGAKLFPISVNVSRVHMENDKFIDELILLTRKYGIDPKYLELELTESACFNDEKRFEETIRTLKRIRLCGFNGRFWYRIFFIKYVKKSAD